MHVPAFVVYAGSGFSDGVLHMLRSNKRAAYCYPEPSLEPTQSTIELDHIVAMTFGWWEAVLRDKRPFNLEAWSASRPAPPVVVAPGPVTVVAPEPRAAVPEPVLVLNSAASVPDESN
jgi:hypothetical protein